MLVTYVCTAFVVIIVCKYSIYTQQSSLHAQTLTQKTSTNLPTITSTMTVISTATITSTSSASVPTTQSANSPMTVPLVSYVRRYIVTHVLPSSHPCVALESPTCCPWVTRKFLVSCRRVACKSLASCMQVAHVQLASTRYLGAELYRIVDELLTIDCEE